MGETDRSWLERQEDTRQKTQEAFKQNLKEQFKLEPFTFQEVKELKLDSSQGGARRQERINALVSDGELRYFTKDRIRYYQFKE